MSRTPYLELGVITGARGLRGQLRVKLFSRDADSLEQVKRVFLLGPRGAAVEYVIAALGLGGRGQIALDLVGCGDRDQAEALAGHRVLVHRDDLRPLPPEEFYLVDAVGCAVVSASGDPLGEVVGVGDNGAHGLLHVRGEEVEMSIPAREPFVVDFDGKRIVVALPEGYAEAMGVPVGSAR